LDNNQEKIEDKISAYKKCNDTKKKRILYLSIIEQTMYIVKQVVSNITLSAGITFEDLLQVGTLGLIKAIDLYELDKNTKFSTYAIYFIRGEILHYLRDNAPIIKAPRTLQELVTKISNSVKELRQQGISNPTVEQLSDIIGVEPEKIEEVMKIIANKYTVSIDQINDDEEDYSLLDRMSFAEYKDDLRMYENKLLLIDLLSQLPQELKEIIEWSYIEGYTQSEIAKKLNISQMQVSRKIKKALNIMYKILTSQGEK
jgi:RNA polymerase sigma factor (sigma-70 family)